VSERKQVVHSEDMKVASHVQREDGDWWLNILMMQGYDVPFKYKRKKRYHSLQGARVNISYYPCNEDVAGISFEYMKVTRLRKS